MVRGRVVDPYALQKERKTERKTEERRACVRARAYIYICIKEKKYMYICMCVSVCPTLFLRGQPE